MRYGFVIDQDRCIGCHACTVACKEEHQVPLGVFRTWVKYIEKGAFPDTSRYFGVMRCNHCDSAPCTTICPTHSLFRRSNGIIDFDNQLCIGCKSCMQACPYDALYIDPNNNTAAKCNFCAHRVEANLEPACVIVCPTQAIIAGDLDDAASKASRIVAEQKVSVRKPEKNTNPKLYYVGIEKDLLDPTRLTRQNTYVFAEQRDKESKSVPFDPKLTREVYDVSHPAPWGWKIAAYLWTKSIAAGVMIVAGVMLGIWPQAQLPVLNIVSPAIVLVALALTMALLVFDLKRPDRFLYLLLKSNFRSWLVLGADVLMAAGILTTVWLFCGVFLHQVSPIIGWSAVVLGIASAGYSAFLFAQAKGRDLWQDTSLFFMHLVVQACAAGAAFFVLVSVWCNFDQWRVAGLVFVALPALVVSMSVALVMNLFEVFRPHARPDASRAIVNMRSGRLKFRFWGLALGVGLVLPLLFYLAAIIFQTDKFYTAIALLALAGLWFFEDVWVRAGQSVPLS
jgi:Fe-S-cluster-containing dehydrogenase component/formate-dependent nitrite reductase membrane component NrfD